MADRYWVGGTANWDGTAGTKWSATSGGGGGASVPTSADDVFFTNLSTGTCTISAGNTGAKSINCTGFTGTLAGSAAITVSGSVTLDAGMTVTYTGTLGFAGTGTGTLTSAGKTLGPVTINSSGITVTLGDALNIGANQLSITTGTFTTNNFNVTADSLSSSTTNTRTINLGSSTVTLSGTNPVDFTNGNATLTFNAGTSLIAITGTASALRGGASGGGTGVSFYNVSFTSTTVTTHAVQAINTFNNLTVTAPAAAGVTQVTFDSRQTINGTLSTTGTAGNRRVWFRGVTYGIAQTLTINSAPSLTDADFRDIYVIGTAAPISGTRIGDLRGIRGITASTPKTVYWNLAGAQNWSANGWAATSTGTPSTDNFPLAQDTATFTNAGSVTGTITLDTALAYCPTVDMSGRTSAMTLGTSNATTVYGNWTNGSGTTLSGGSTLTFSGRNTQTITSSGKNFTGSITVDTYGGAVELADAINVGNGTGTLTVTNGTFDTKNFNVTAGTLSSSNSNVRTITLGSSTVTLSSNVTFTTSTNLTLNSGTSQINQNPGANFSGGGLTFYNLSFAAGSGSATSVITGANTFNNLTVNGPNAAGIYGATFAANQTITGTLTVAGATAVRRIFVRSNTIGTPRTLTVNAISATDCDFRDITLAGTASGASPTRAGDCGGNSGITFPAPKTVYWNLAGAQNWSATAWAPGSGGTPNINNFPLAQDTAVFDNTGSVTGTITINADWNIGTFDASLRTSAMTLTTATNSPSVYGDWKFGTGVTSSSTSGTITFSSPTTETITSNGVQFGCNVTINHPLANVQLADAISLNSARTLTLTSGTFDAVTYNVTTGLFDVTVTTNTTLKMGSGTWTLSGTGNLWMASTAPNAFYKGTANIVLSDTSTSARTFAGRALSYNKLTIGGTTGTSTLALTGNNQFTELASTKTVAHTIALGTTTQTFGAWTVTGTAGNVVTLTGTGTSHILAGACTSGIDYLAMGSIGFAATSPGEFYAGANSTGTAAAPVYRTAKPADSTRYWVGGTGNWSDTARWSTGSGGGSGASVPRSHDDVVFDSASNATAYTATVDAVTGGIRMKALTIAGPASGNVTLAGSTAMVGIHGNVTLPATGLTRTYTGAITLSSNSTGLTFTTNGVALASAITVNGVGCGWTLGSALNIGTSALALSNGTFDTANYAVTVGNITCSSQNAATLSLGSSSIAASGTLNFSGTGLTLNAGTSTISNDRGNSAHVVNGGSGVTLYNYSVTATNPSSVTVNGANTFNNFTVAGKTSAGVTPISFDANQTVTGTLTLSAGTNATMRHFLQSDTIGTTRTITAAAFSGTDADFRDITIAGAAAPVSGTRLGDCKGNSGITFGAGVTRYWNLAGSNNWSATGWAASSGASPAVNNFPLAQDTAVFEATSPGTGTTTTINAAYNIGTIDMSARTSNTMTLAIGSTTPAIYGNWINGTGTTLTGTGNPIFSGRNTQTITSAGVTFSQGIDVESPSGTVRLLDAFISSRATAGTLALISGTFDANGYNVTFSGSASSAAMSGAATRTMAIGSGTWTIAGSGTSWNSATSTNLTVTGTGTISLTSASAKTFAGGGVSYSGITLDQGGAGTLTISGNNTFKDITNTYKATGATTIAMGTTTQTVSQFTAAGEAGRVLTVQGASASSPATLILTGATKPNLDYLTITGVRAYSLDTTWYAGANSTNNGSLGWYFESGVVAITATISETSTASDAVTTFLTFLANASETATATDSTSTANNTFNSNLSETATATDALAATLTLLAQVADAATTTDTVSVQMVFSSSLAETATVTDETSNSFLFAGVILESATATDAPSTANNTFNPSLAETATGTDTSSTANNTFNPSLSETATGTDAPSTANNTFNPSLAETATGTDSPAGNWETSSAVSETATATDTTQSAVIFVGAVSETATASDLISSLTDFLARVSENANITDVTLVAPSVFGPQVQEAATALDSISTNGTFNVQLVESATALDSIIGAFLWNLIDDSQNPNWVDITSTQNPNWTGIDDSQNPNWQNVDT